MTILDTKPAADEHAPFAATYIAATATALAAAADGRLLTVLDGQMDALRALLTPVGHDVFHRGYAPGKWTLAESLVHVADVERVFAYRLLRIARGDTTPLPSFDHDAWVPVSGATRRSQEDILTELAAVRAATLVLIRSLDETALGRVGTASGNPVSARALTWMITGHFAHHLELTRTRYLGGA